MIMMVIMKDGNSERHYTYLFCGKEKLMTKGT
jgi:hypothetical protein